MLGVIFLNGSIFGVYSYISSFLGEVTRFSAEAISGLLFFYGLMNILGNFVAGKALSERARTFMLVFPVLLAGVYILMLLIGGYAIPAAVVVIIWGVLAGAAGNINQYWISSAAPEASEFANGLFLTASNLGTTIATSLCGALTTWQGISSIFSGGLLLLIHYKVIAISVMNFLIISSCFPLQSVSKADISKCNLLSSVVSDFNDTTSSIGIPYVSQTCNNFVRLIVCSLHSIKPQYLLFSSSASQNFFAI